METKATGPSPFYTAIKRYKESIEAYKKFGGLVSVAVNEYADGQLRSLSKRINKMLEAFSESAPMGEQEAISQAFLHFGTALQDNLNQRKAKLQPEGADTVIHTKDSLGHGTFALSHRPGKVFLEAVKMIATTIQSPRENTSILYQGILTGLVGQFEVLLSDLAIAYYRRAPKAALPKEKTMPIGELFSFSSLEEVLEFVIEERVDDLLRGSADDWREFFKARMKVDLEGLSADWPRFIECIQRRHLIVHAGGKISRRYLKLVEKTLISEFFGDGAFLGRSIDLDEDYISKSISLFESTGLILAFSCWSRLEIESGERQSEILSEIVYETMLQNAWQVVLHLTKWGTAQEHFGANATTALQINHWLAIKRLGLWEECREEVEAFDVSALKTIYAIAKYALTGDNDKCFELIAASKAAEFDDRTWTEWPLFVEIRQDPRFEYYKDKLGSSLNEEKYSAANGRTPLEQ